MLLLRATISITFVATLVAGLQTECAKKFIEDEDFVCACNSTYCDFIKPLPASIKPGSFVMYRSSKNIDRFNRTINAFVKGDKSSAQITIDPSKRYQQILGFGGAFTDAALMNIDRLPKPAQDHLLHSYFGPVGIKYIVIRVPIAGTDFSVRAYTYDDGTKPDLKLQRWKLAPEDIHYKIPYLKRVLALQRGEKNPLKLMACPWTAPSWMKRNRNYYGGPGSQLLPKYYQLWADYYIKFFDAYAKHNITFAIVSAQNEPALGSLEGYDISGMSFTPEEQATFVNNNLGPTLRKKGYGDLKLVILEDSREFVVDWISRFIANNSNAMDYVSGAAVHWYTDMLSPSELLDKAHDIPGFEGKFLLYSEACTGYTPFQEGVEMGSWTRGEEYLHNIIMDLNNWSVGWTDWNVALDEQGGPNFSNNEVDSPIIVMADNQTFCKQPMYYALGHATRFLEPGSTRLGVNNTFNFVVKATAFQTPNNQTVVIILNDSGYDYPTTIADKSRDGVIKLTITKHSFHTLIY